MHIVYDVSDRFSSDTILLTWVHPAVLKMSLLNNEDGEWKT